ncbi:MAG TPA: three-Cys-motif partner protein TcmP [Nitrosarchaeum sp.]
MKLDLMVEPYVLVRGLIQKLNKSVSNFHGEIITTPDHGVWSVKKLIAVYMYIKPYIEIMRKNGYKKLHYVDLFAGSGLLKIDGKMIPGTALIPFIRIEDGFIFDEYHLADEKQKFVSKLNERIKSIEKNKTNVSIEASTFDDSVTKLFSNRNGAYKDNGYLVVLDPFGLDISWNQLVQILSGRAVDIFITFMTSQTQRQTNISHSESALTRIFGDESWKDNDDLLKHYRNKIETIPSESHYPYKTSVITVETKGSSKYHLIFASKSKIGAQRPFKYIQELVDAVDKNLLNDAFSGAMKPESNIDYYFNK